MTEEHSEQRPWAQPPLLRPIEDGVAREISPWPARIAGDTPWLPAPPSTNVRAEYDDLYSPLLSRWEQYSGKLSPGLLHPGALLAFFARSRRLLNLEVARRVDTYGCPDIRQFLVSIADRLYAGDLNLMEVTFRSLVVERMMDLQERVPFDGVVELGCGSGVNLANLSLQLGLDWVAGCDAAPGAIRFLERAAGDVSWPARFACGPFEAGTVTRLRPEGRWALCSVHALEQSRELPEVWLDAFLSSPATRPTVGIHFEPVVWPEDTGSFARSCAAYAALNRYNQNLAALLRRDAERGTIRIIHEEHRVFGHSAFNPTSVIAWVPAT